MCGLEEMKCNLFSQKIKAINREGKGLIAPRSHRSRGQHGEGSKVTGDFLGLSNVERGPRRGLDAEPPLSQRLTF